MPARTDHDRQDAQHAARLMIAMQMGRYIRRARDRAYAIIEQEATEYDGTDPLDWSAIGSAAANQAIREIAGTATAAGAVDAAAVAELEPSDGIGAPDA